jgi:hypothetical protein
MIQPKLSHLQSLFIGITLLASASLSMSAQQTGGQAAKTPTLISQLAAAFSGGQVVQQVQLSGSATWDAGSLHDSGTVNLTAAASGSSQVQLSLDSSGQRTETEAGTGLGEVCQWAGADGTAHTISADSCLKPAVWFLPSLSLQPSLLPSYLELTDLGPGTVGNSTNVYRHLQGQLLFTALPSTPATEIAQESTTDFGLDPLTLLPAVLAYAVHPDNGAASTVSIEIHYSNYRAVNGVQIPFHIQRYVNGSLQLDILVNSAQID